ncbi:MAG: hypothetical protein ABIR24_15130, partial [Verrucomicrobiota bacterium]
MKTQQSLPSSTDHSTCFLPARVGKRLLALAFAIFLAANARANFHLWDVAEIYSNEDGSVQF